MKKTMMYELKTNKFHEVIDGKVYFPLAIDPTPATPAAGDILTTGEIWNSNEVVRCASNATGMSLLPRGDVTYEFIATV